MKKLFGFSLALLFFTACVKDSPTQEVEAKQQTPPSPYAVSVEDAVQNLNDVMGSATRADGTRAVIDLSRITVVGGKQFGATTRTADGEALPDSLIYIIPFEDEGCAVVAADIRLTPVYAILSTTQLTPEDFEQMYNSNTELSEQEDLQAMLIDGIKNEMIGEIVGIDMPKYDPHFPDATLNPNAGGNQDAPNLNQDGNASGYWFNVVVPDAQVEPMVTSKWDQGSPYNDQCPMDPDYPSLRSVAGCVAIATGQLMAYWQKPNPCVIDGETFSWGLISQCTSARVTATPQAWDETAHFVHAIGKAVDMVYGSTGSKPDATANWTQLEIKLFTQMGFKAAQFIGYNRDIAMSMLKKQQPFFMQGSTSTGKTGHAWVVDGCNIYTTQHWLRSYLSENPHGPYSDKMMSAEQTALIYCNFGAGTLYDGCYTDDIVNIFVKNFYMISY